MDAEEKADRAANEIVDLVAQEVQHSTTTSQITGPRLSPDMHISAHPIATDTREFVQLGLENLSAALGNRNGCHKKIKKIMPTVGRAFLEPK